jgi:uncharacterized membrane protein YdbT with pleckstrin-like domain
METESLRQHKETECKKLSSQGRKFFDLIEFDETEKMVIEIRKHPFGLFVVEFVGLSITLLIALFMIVVPQTSFNNLYNGDTSTVSTYVTIAGVLLTLLAFAGTVVSSILYSSNVIFVTTDKIAQVLYTSILSRKISQLSIGDVQDVTVSQNGIFARIFNFGTLVIETAGEQQNYTFTYVPKPATMSKAIIGAHEDNLHAYGN